MIAQLLLVGYLLNFIFTLNRWESAVLIVIFMILVSSLIAVRSLPEDEGRRHFPNVLLAVGVGGTINLLLVLFAVLQLKPFFQLEVLIPLAGMIYSNGMNAVSLGGERFWKQVESGSSYEEGRTESFRAAMIPQVNSFLAVGLVALPGMMTGQVLSGISPLIAVRYQIMVMCMVLGTSGISLAIYLFRVKSWVEPEKR
jgi:putative ABC transport system permease protein